MTPIPARAMAHCAVLLPGVEDVVSYFMTGLEERFLGFDTAAVKWTAMAYPRPCTYADLHLGAWEWRVVLDPAGCTEALESSLRQCAASQPLPIASGPWGLPPTAVEAALAAHRASVLIFVTGSPEDATPLEVLRALARVAWAWVDAGASLVAWPEGRVAWDPAYLREFRPSALGPEE
ncbi:MAG: hypothetical protein AB1758_22785, partial [Candidatus Eremiobacterota bacterium]